MGPTKEKRVKRLVEYTYIAIPQRVARVDKGVMEFWYEQGLTRLELKYWLNIAVVLPSIYIDFRH